MTSGLSFNSFQISRILPHKYPFLLLDTAYDINPGKRGFGKKNISINEWFFQGHFPDNPILPGVIIAEALAQLTAVVYCSEHLIFDDNSDVDLKNDGILHEITNHVGYLAKIDMKFLKPVVPGDTMILNVEIIKKVSNLLQVQVQSRVNRQMVAEGFLNVSEKN